MSSNAILASEIELSPDMADFTGLGSRCTFGDACTWLNEYVDKNNLANGQLPLLGGSYPGPLITCDDCLNYLFIPHLGKTNIAIENPITYSQFKALCLYHMTFVHKDG